MKKKAYLKIMEPVTSIILAFLLGAIVILIIGQNPIESFGVLFKGAFGSNVSITNTLLGTTTLTFAGLSYAFAARCGVCNIGAEGQIYTGALGATLMVLYCPGPGWLVIIVALIVGTLFGGIFGVIAGWLKVKFKVNEFIITVMLNYVAQYLVQWAVCGPIQDPNSKVAQTITFDTKYWLATIPGTKIHIGVFILLLALAVFGFFLWKTKAGLAMQIVGHNNDAAAYAGIGVDRNLVMSMFIAGCFAGLGGAIEVLGVQHRLLKGMASNYGYDGIAVALLGDNGPVGMLFAGILLGAMKSGGNALQMFTKVPSSVVSLIRAFVIVFVLINLFGFTTDAVKKRKARRKGSEVL